MNALRFFVIMMLLASASVFAAEPSGKGDKKIDVEQVDVPETMVVQPTPEEIHEDSITRSCSSCHVHGDMKAEPKPMNHFLTTRECGDCHFSKSWVPLRYYRHLSGRYKPNATPQECLSCHASNSEYLR